MAFTDSTPSFTPKAGPALLCRLLRTHDQMGGVRDSWIALQAHPEIDFDFFDVQLQLGHQPIVFAIYEGAKCVALVAGLIQKDRLELGIGGRILWRPKVRRLALGPGSFMGAEDSRILEFAVEQLLIFLQAERLDLMVYHGLRWSSPLRLLLQSKPRFICRDPLVRPKNHWVMRLPHSLDDLFQTRMTKKRRYWARRKIRFLEREFPNRIRYVWHSSNEKLADLLRDISTIARQSDLWDKGVGYQELPEQKNQISLFARKGLLRAVVLHIDEQPISYWVGFRYAQRLYLYYTGFVPRFRRDEPGTLALYQMIARACEEGVDYMYMGAGPFEYQRRLSTEHFNECDLLVFSGSLRGKLLNCLRMGIFGPLELVRRTIKAAGIGGSA